MRLDWSGQTCLIVASGPSLSSIDLSVSKGKCKTIAINTSWSRIPWADVLYACDWAWWNENRGVPDFQGIKICGDERAKREKWNCETITVLRGDDRLTFQPGVVGRGGGSGGFQAANLAVQWGVSKIILAGFDCSIAKGLHWHGAHGRKLGNPNMVNTRNWRRAMDAAAPVFKEKGIAVVNVSMASELTAYPKMTLAEALSI
jgi:hypothetical protein